MCDQKSFYASVSCIEKGLDPLMTKLAVVADTKRQDLLFWQQHLN